MSAIKQIFIISFLLLSACAPRPESFNNSPATASTTNKPVIEQTLSDGKETPPLNTEVKTGAPAKSNSAVNTGANNNVTSWNLSGAMAARNKNKGWSASINWLQKGSNHYQIRFFGPLGSGTVMIDKNGSNVVFRDGPKTASSTNADELLHQQTGIRLPVQNLYYWVRGLPAPGAVQASKYDAMNRLISLKQAGFNIEYLQYTSVGKAVLPSQIRLQGNGVFIKLVIRRWKLN